MDKVMCFGSAGKDMLFPTDEGKIMETPEDLMSQKKIAFELGAKIRIKERYESLGGCAANVAVGMARLGVETLCASSVGSDIVGGWVKEELEKNKVDVASMVVEEGRESDFSAIIVDEASADRIIFTNKNSSGKLNFNNLKNTEATWFFISDIYGKWEDQLEMIFEAARNGNKRVAFNPREAGIREDAVEVIEAIGLCEIVFVNKDEAIEIVSNMHADADPENVNDEKFLLEKLKSLEPKIVVLTDGMRGAWASNGEDVFYAAAKKVQAVDSTGAGDSFTGAFLAAYIKGQSLRECLQWGIANSASEVQHYGAIEGLMMEDEIVKEAEKVVVEKL
ncbi:MAG: carbohydrate kinase family protein [Parcubacteria group bacterium]